MSRSRRTLWVGVALVVLVAGAVSLAGLPNELIQDDGVLIAENLRLHDLGNWWQLLTTPFWPAPWNQDLYRPLTSLLLAVEFWAGGGAPVLFRCVSVLCYAGLSVGVLFLAGRLLPWGVAVAVGVLFAAHPVHVEAVALAVAQNELLVALLAVGMTLRYLALRTVGDGTVPARDWGGIALMYLVAALLKEQGLLLPAFLLAAEWTLLRGRARQGLWLGYAGLLLAGLAVLGLRAVVLGGDVAGTFVAEAYQGTTLPDRALALLTLVVQWLRYLVWPAHLQADWTPQEFQLPTRLGPVEFLGLICLAAWVAAVLTTRRNRPAVAFGLLWCGIALFPVSNVLIPTGIVIAERTMMLPSVGFLVTIGALAHAAWESARVGGELGRRGLVTAGVLLGIAGTVRSALRERVWRTEVAFATQGVIDAPESYRMQMAYGFVRFTTGRPDEGQRAYDRALALAPAASTWRVRNDLARRYYEVGRPDLAVAQLEASLAGAPRESDTWRSLILGVLALGDYPRAIRLADSAMVAGGPSQIFLPLRALADSAWRDNAPPGSIRVRVVRPPRSTGSP